MSYENYGGHDSNYRSEYTGNTSNRRPKQKTTCNVKKYKQDDCIYELTLDLKKWLNENNIEFRYASDYTKALIGIYPESFLKRINRLDLLGSFEKFRDTEFFTIKLLKDTFHKSKITFPFKDNFKQLSFSETPKNVRSLIHNILWLTAKTLGVSIESVDKLFNFESK